MRYLAVVVIVAACGGAKPKPGDASRPVEIEHAGVSGEVAKQLGDLAARGRAEVEQFFDTTMPAPFTVRVFPDRAALNAHWRAAWDMPDFESECWMVASGGVDELAILSPQAWATDACEHDATDAARIAMLVTHEVVHVFHEQVHPSESFDGLDAIGWFVEGVAVFASGQLESDHLASAADAIAEGAAPTELENAWSGKYRYGVSGSLVAYIDARWGRAMVKRLLTASDEAEILGALGLSEAQLLQAWAEQITASN